MSFNIAIDGPAGAGKSTIAKRAAKELSFIYVDTGAMYRAIALGLLRRGTDIEDEAALSAALDETEVGIRYVDGEQHVYLNGEDVSSLIRTEKVSDMTSRSSAIPVVRAKLTDLQRDLARREDVLMDGRDIGTTILPDADLKIYLTASVETRAKRRYLEQVQKGETCSLEEIEKDICERDYRDSHRETAPLRQAEDAVRMDSSDMTIEEVVAEILRLVKERRAQTSCIFGEHREADGSQDFLS
ncbi:MAG: (d)CMP kinase [Lachnospiraceae bacterium]|nr:(d)CMP kinase [Lachnospiraceae bacterium]